MKMFKPLFLTLAAAICSADAYPCSRVVLRGDNTDIVMVGRTLDWRTPIPTDIYVYPAGMAKMSMPSGQRIEWTSKFGSVLAVGYDGGVTEGMNERGLVCNALFCKNAVYREAAKGSDTPVMSLAVMVSYFLDLCETVDDVKTYLKTANFGIYGKTFDGGTASLLHWGFTDRSGNTLIMEYNNGQLSIYESKNFQVLTNDPNFEKMRSINEYWQQVGGENFLPGGVRSPDRFVRADYFIRHVPTQGLTAAEALAELSSIMANVSVPFKYEVAGQPELSSTQWTSISDTGNLRYHFKFADSPETFYIDLSKLPLTPGASVLKLDTANHQVLSGNANRLLKKSKPFTPIW